MDLQAIREKIEIPTYGVGEPEKNPAFFEKRVYQGSCGKVYPVPFIDKVFDEPRPQTYDSVRLENDYLRLVMLPEIGGRIFLGQDKVNNDYDFFYRQDVIKPALVGLAGPWISGGVEFNWPQHHRPGTFMPTDVHIEEGSGGAQTVWLSEHDPINRLKGMHGIRMQPGSALIELKARLFNRTPFTQTFLWWANVAAKVHDNYQSFFPPDVHYVADHAVRAQSAFPLAQNDYYGIDYAARPGANDLGWYKNIPVPTSYMVCDTGFDFFGGYDHDAQGGFIHVANQHISPGKKQWTWGNHEFGWAWNRELTDENGPYVELMAGVYTDNQPDFSYLLPYETKTFSQFWWPFKNIGPVQNATKDAAVRLVLNADRSLDLGAVASRAFDGARIVLRQGDQTLLDERVDLSPDAPWQNQSLTFEGDDVQALELSVEGLVSYRPIDTAGLERKREVATEPSAPNEIESVEELYLTAERLAALEAEPSRVAERDDCTVELAALYNETCQPEKALALLQSRRFHPWEGGEGQVLRQYTEARLLLGQKALEADDAETALNHFRLAMDTPENLGEAYHLLQAKADVNYWIGKALRALGRETEAIALFEDLKAFAEREFETPAEIDYFATSLPLILVFEDDLDQCKKQHAKHLLMLAKQGLV